MNIRKLSGDERIKRAKERADKLVGHIATLFLMHEANANEAEPVGADASSDPQHVAARKTWWKKDRSAFAQEAEQQVRQQLAFASDKAAEVRASLRPKAMRKFRAAYIAHNLT